LPSTRAIPDRDVFYVAEPLSSILFLFALQMLFGRLDSNRASPEAGRDLAVFPLAVPSIAGPGAMMAVIVLTDNVVYTVPEQAEIGIVLLVVLLPDLHFPAFFRFHLASHRPAGRGHPRPGDGNY
jgi:small neutral amino acid transporter SnatA (MarC family)